MLTSGWLRLALLLLPGITIYQAAAQPVTSAQWPAAIPYEIHEAFQRHVGAARAESLAATPPSILSGQILTPTVDVTKQPGQPSIQLQLDPGASIVSVMEIELVSPSGKQAIYNYAPVPAYPPLRRGGRYTIQLGSSFSSQTGFNLYSEPGAWSINSITLATASGSPASYSATQLAAIFPSIVINVVNPGTADVSPPAIGHGKVLTPSVSVSSAGAAFVAQFPVADPLSGLRFAQVILIGPNGTDRLFANTLLNAPFYKGNVPVFTQVPANTALGTWTIFDVRFCDVAGNCGDEFSPAQIQSIFGTTTFQVVN